MGRFYIAMTYAKGLTLSDLLRKHRQLDVEEATLIIKQVARGLLYAHSKGVIHRDIKPSNIIVSPDNRVYITDFGISLSHNDESKRLTSTGTAMGTPEYMSPEQCQGDEITQQSDIYSLGIILYEMLCGDPPFIGTKPLEIAYKQVHSLPESPRIIRPEIPVPMENLILKCLRKNRSERFQGAAQFLEELDRVLQSSQPDQPPVSAPKSPTRKLGSIISRRDAQTWLVPLAFGLIALLTLLQVLLVLVQREEQAGAQILKNFELSAPWEQLPLETDSPNGYSLANLLDNELQTAWLLPASDIQKNPILVVHFDKPTLVLELGVAIGYQKSRDDALQDRFSMFQKPSTLIIKSVEGSAQKIHLQNVKGMQYTDFLPVETTELRIEMRDIIPGNTANIDLALSELRLIGMPLPEKK
jgi:serine/threonine protein kinase